MEGWISLHRKILENPIVCKDSDHVAIWVYLLLNATHSEQKMLFGGKPILLKPGQLITGRKSIADKLKISESKVQRVLDLFKTEQQIEQQTNNKHRLVTIVNWGFYQDNKKEEVKTEQQDELPVNNKRTTTEQQLNTNNNVNNGFNVNNDNKEINKKPLSDFFDDKKLNEIFLDFIKMRKSLKKPMTDRAITIMKNKLNTHSPEIAFAMLEKSILNSWLDVYELKETDIKKNKPMEQPAHQQETQSRFNTLTEEERNYYYGKGAFYLEDGEESIDFGELTAEERKYLQEKGVI